MKEGPTLSVRDFPICAPMRTFEFPEHMSPQLEEDPNRNIWFMCLWKTAEDDVCSFPCGDFENFLFHLREQHGISMKANVDFCRECEVIFKNKTEAVNHYLEKALLFENCSLTLTEDRFKEMNDCLAYTFGQIKEIRKNVLDEILFTEEMPQEMPSLEIDTRQVRGSDTCDCPSHRHTVPLMRQN